MKKSLIALAVMAAAGAASAQSSVQLYGIADLWFGSVKSEGIAHNLDANDKYDPTYDGVRQTVLESGGVNTSRWGIKGSEDLGGGLKANFKLEQGFYMDDGAVKNGTGFTRQAYVGLSGGFGEVQLGKVWSAYDDVSGAQTAVFDSALSGTVGVFASTGYQDYNNNGIKYISPNFSGFTFGASYALGEDKTATESAGSITAFNVQYANGPVAVAVGYQTEEEAGNPVSTDFTRIGGSYDFGVAKLLASYGKAENKNFGEATEYQIGVDVPLASNIILSANYATSEDESVAGVKGDERQGFGAAVAYVLSKRTMVYGGFRQNTTDDNTGKEIGKTTVYAIGLNHKF